MGLVARRMFSQLSCKQPASSPDLHVGAPDVVQDLCLAHIDVTQDTADGGAQHRLVSSGTSSLKAGQALVLQAQKGRGEERGGDRGRSETGGPSGGRSKEGSLNRRGAEQVCGCGTCLHGASDGRKDVLYVV